MYDAPPTLIPQLERYFQLEENVLRHLTIKMTGPAIEFRKQFLVNRAERLSAEAAAAAAPAETTTESDEIAA
jgi:ribosomal protein S6